MATASPDGDVRPNGDNNLINFDFSSASDHEMSDAPNDTTISSTSAPQTAQKTPDDDLAAPPNDALLASITAHEAPADDLPFYFMVTDQEVEVEVDGRVEDKPEVFASIETPDAEVLEDTAPDEVLEDAPVFKSSSARLEVLIKPLDDETRKQYTPGPPSDVVYAILDHEDSIYTIEFEDGRLGYGEFNDVLDRPNGAKALRKFTKAHTLEDDSQPLAFSNMAKKRKTQHPDSDYSDNDMAGENDLDVEMEDDKNDDHDDETEDLLFSKLVSKSRSAKSTRSLRRSGRQTAQPASRMQSFDDEIDDDAEAEPEVKPWKGPGSRRGLRSRKPASTLATRNGKLTRASTVFDEDEDELAANDGEYSLVQSDLGDRRGKHKRKPRTSTAPQFREDSIEYEGSNRRSSRATKNTKNMEDPTNVDDEIFADEELGKIVKPKSSGMKEIFQPLNGNDFKEVHSQMCDSCNKVGTKIGRGQIIFCQGCSLSYHEECLRYRGTREHLVTKIGHENFVLQCRHCVGVPRAKDEDAPRHDVCQTCRAVGPACKAFAPKRTPAQEQKLRKDNDGVDPITTVSDNLINKPANVLFRCTNCKRGYHYECLPPPSDSWVDPEDGDVRGERLAEYSIEWKCRTCIDFTDDIDALVAWRPTDREAAQEDMDTAKDTAKRNKSQIILKTYHDYDDDSREYLVKPKGKSHAHCVWMPGAWVFGAVSAPMRKSFPKRDDGANLLPRLTDEEAIPEEWLLADVILAVTYRSSRGGGGSKEADMDRISDIKQVRIKFQGLPYDQTVWDGPPSRDSGTRWAAFEAAYNEFLNGKYFKKDTPARMRERLEAWRAEKIHSLEVLKQPAGLRGELMHYQLFGLNWLLLNYYNRKSVVLADEMGLGKTVQVIALLTSLTQEKPKCWPYLVVVPNSTCPNWRREIKFWAPELRVVTYHGGKAPQKLAYDNELFPNGTKDMRAHVVVMSYDSAQDPETRLLFKSVQWAGLVVDEGQRLKNDQNLLYQALQKMKIEFRLLLTGTPLQNNKRELFNLLQFIDDTRNAAALDEQYAEITAEVIPELHELIRPYFLRRTKLGVLKFLPPMAQIIVPVTMTSLQTRVCKSIMTKNPELVKAIFAKGKLKSGERSNLNNILMQLRKALCHPFIYSEAIEEKTVDLATMNSNLIEASSKLMLLKIMLPKLKEGGHRVLLFSQFLGQLDIIEDFLNILELPYERLDGNMSSLEKQKKIDKYNAPDSNLFAFLLSTRAGGVGINLATADTVIILDPDFNPHQDIQALSRAHRIGQQNTVLCFQFMTKASVEEKILQIGRKKMALDHALIESMDMQHDAGNDLESILKHGAEALFNDKEQQENAIVYDSASVDKLLDRSDVKKPDADAQTSAESQFSHARVWANSTGDFDDDLQVAEEQPEIVSTSIWDTIIRQRDEAAREAAEANKQVLGRGGRTRQKVDYSMKRAGIVADPQLEAALGIESESSEDDDNFVNNGAESADDDSDPEAPPIMPGEVDLSAAGQQRKKRSPLSKRVSNQATPVKAAKATKAATPAKQAAKSKAKRPAKASKTVKSPPRKKQKVSPKENAAQEDDAEADEPKNDAEAAPAAEATDVAMVDAEASPAAEATDLAMVLAEALLAADATDEAMVDAEASPAAEATDDAMADAEVSLAVEVIEEVMWDAEASPAAEANDEAIVDAEASGPLTEISGNADAAPSQLEMPANPKPTEADSESISERPEIRLVQHRYHSIRPVAPTILRFPYENGLCLDTMWKPADPNTSYLLTPFPIQFVEGVSPTQAMLVWLVPTGTIHIQLKLENGLWEGTLPFNYPMVEKVCKN